jgi:hypothetical protein
MAKPEDYHEYPTVLEATILLKELNRSGNAQQCR